MHRIIHSKKRTRLVVAGIAVMLGLTATAFAYWTSSGEGKGEVTATSGGAGFEVSNLAVTVKVKDKDENQPERLTKLEAEVEKTSKETEPEPCKKTWFVASPASQEPKVTLAHGETKEYTVHLEMKEEATENQNGCKGATVTLKYKAS
jgi:hypothetical protein